VARGSCRLESGWTDVSSTGKHDRHCACGRVLSGPLGRFRVGVRSCVFALSARQGYRLSSTHREMLIPRPLRRSVMSAMRVGTRATVEAARVKAVLGKVSHEMVSKTLPYAHQPEISVEV